LLSLLFYLLLAPGCGHEINEAQENGSVVVDEDEVEVEVEVEDYTPIDITWAEILGEENLIDDNPLGELPLAIDETNIQTITIFGNQTYERILQQARDEMNIAWATEGREYTLHIEFESYTYGEWFVGNQRINVELMAGLGPDLILVHHTPVWNWVRSGLFTDIYQLMDKSPNTSRDYFYTNVLEALEYDGRLYVFPLSFGFEYVAINERLPQTFIDRFKQYNFISMGDLFDIYIDLINTYYYEFGHMRIGGNAVLTNAAQAIFYGMAPFIDFNTREVALTNNDFVDFLRLIPQIFTLEDLFQMSMIRAIPMSSANDMSHLANRYVFFVEHLDLGPVNAFFDPVTPHFVHFIPIVCELGNLRIDHTGIGPTWQHISIPAVGDGELAWEFTQHLLNAMAYPDLQSQARAHSIGSYSFATPIRRDMFQPRVRSIMEHALYRYAQPFIGMDDEATRTQLIDDAIVRLSNLNEMPITAAPFIQIYDINYNVIEQLLVGIISAEDAAQSLHNQIALRLIE